MHILLLTNIFPSKTNPAGGTFIQSRVKAIRDLGLEISPVAVGGIPKGAGKLRPQGMVDATVEVSAIDRLIFRRRGENSRIETRAAMKVLSVAGHFDAVMAHGMFSLAAGRVARLVSAAHSVPFSVHLHGSDVNVVMARRPNAVLPTLRDATSVVFVSQALHERAVSNGLPRSVGHVIPNGVDTSIFDVSLRTQGEHRSLRIGFVGNLLEVKGADRLPAIFRLVKMSGVDATLEILGDGPLRPSLEDELRSDRVCFLGRVSQQQVAQRMANFDVLILPSRSEGWPTVIHESYAVGTPVVGALVGGVGEALISRHHGVPEGAQFAARFARKTVEVARSQDRASLIEHASNFSWHRIVSHELEALTGKFHD